MEVLVLQYAWILLVLIGLEGLLAADNAVVMAVMVKHLPKPQQKKALFYGLSVAFLFRFLALFAITLLVNIWQIQALGAAYLLFIAAKHLFDQKKHQNHPLDKHRGHSGFWMTVLKIEVADIAFAVDSMLAAVALALTLPHWGTFTIGGINGGQFSVMIAGGLIGVVLMRFAAHKFVRLLERYPQLETAAFIVVGWVGVKLAVLTLSHEKIAVLPHDFPHSLLWTVFFWSVMIGIVAAGALMSVKQNERDG
ncbi:MULTISPECIES: TerC family protein [Caryophanaceae]|uniref:YkoY family integral membrane protein n=1 Tax=Planomicrobium stackebrandtii TaxID=253160 RepID=A0ABU0GPP4_9BACL|nr:MULTISPECIES: TerC family protein [Planococcaceae]MDQ0427302.1 YkoY family integral membrane protein [Planomicrobium stackebrandtii]